MLVGGGSAHDPMRRGQAGGRYDWKPSKSTDATLQGDAYAGRLGLINSTDTSISGGNVLGRWARKSPRSGTQVTAFYDVVQRHVPDQFGEVHHTFDVDAQQTLAVRDVHSLVWGGGYRATIDRTEETPVLFFEPRNRTTHLFNVFVQDEIRLGRNGWFATVGTKLEHNSYSGWELQPTGRVRLTKPRGTVWGAISRAVRMPTRFDSDIRVTLGQPVVVITGSPAFEPEQLMAYEAGVRTQVASELTFDVSVYHDDYRRLRSQELVPGAPITLGNTIQGHIDGIELGATWEPTETAEVSRRHDLAAQVARAGARQPRRQRRGRQRRVLPGAAADLRRSARRSPADGAGAVYLGAADAAPGGLRRGRRDAAVGRAARHRALAGRAEPAARQPPGVHERAAAARGLRAERLLHDHISALIAAFRLKPEANSWS